MRVMLSKLAIDSLDALSVSDRKRVARAIDRLSSEHERGALGSDPLVSPATKRSYFRYRVSPSLQVVHSIDPAQSAMYVVAIATKESALPGVRWHEGPVGKRAGAHETRHGEGRRGWIKRYFAWLFLTGPEGLSDRTNPQDAAANSVAKQVAQADAERAIMPYELLRYLTGCLVIVVVALGFFGMIEEVGPYLAGEDAKVEVFGFEFVEHFVWVPIAVSAVLAGAFWRMRKLKKNLADHVAKRNRTLKDNIVSLQLGNEHLRTSLEKFLSQRQIQTFEKLGECARGEVAQTRDHGKAEDKADRVREALEMADKASRRYLSIVASTRRRSQGAEAGDIATRADLNRTEEVKMVNDEIRRIFSNEDVPVEAVKMQLHTLAKECPEILEQSEKIDRLVERLRLTRGTQIQTVEDQPATSGPPPTSTAD